MIDLQDSTGIPQRSAAFHLGTRVNQFVQRSTGVFNVPSQKASKDECLPTLRQVDSRRVQIDSNLLGSKHHVCVLEGVIDDSRLRVMRSEALFHLTEIIFKRIKSMRKTSPRSKRTSLYKFVIERVFLADESIPRATFQESRESS
jgi:hypothetical protein